MLLRYLLWGIPVLVLGFCLFIGVGNGQPCTFIWFDSQQQLKTGDVFLIGISIGLLCGAAVLYAQRAQQKGQEGKLADWKTQDVKLAAEVKSDREKQLEAKISTLEAALKAALKK